MKVGDKVICIDDAKPEHTVLEKGAVYTVMEIYDDSFIVIDHRLWAVRRFVVLDSRDNSGQSWRDREPLF